MNRALLLLAVALAFLGCARGDSEDKAAENPNAHLYELTSGAGQSPGVTPDELENYVPWNEAVDLVMDGQVETFLQAPTLAVTLRLSDGRVVQTIQPDANTIPLVFSACGEPCFGTLEESAPRIAIERPADRERSSLQMRLVVEEGAEGSEVMELDGEALTLAGESVLTEEDVATVSLDQDQFGETAIVLSFTDSAAARLAAASREHIGGRMALVVDGKILMAPVIQNTLDSEVMIQPADALTVEEARQVAEGLAP